MTLRFRAPSRRDLLWLACPPSGRRWFSWAAEIAGIRFERRRRGRSVWRYLHIHGDESTAREVLAAHQRSAPGTAFYVCSRTRLVSLGGARLDPNRLFSRAGALRNLYRLNPMLPESQIANLLLQLEEDRESFLGQILPRRGGALIALHNNSRGYSMQSEEPISDQVSWKQPSQPQEFLLVTDARDWETIAASPFNAVLQQNPPPPDDGSLSRLCAARGLRYINIEAQMGNFAAQQAMLAWIFAHLPERRD